MSRRLPSNQRRLPAVVDNNPYQPTTVSTSHNGCLHHKPGHHSQHSHSNSSKARCSKNYSRPTTIDIGLSDETNDAQSFYEYYEENGFTHSPLKEEYTYSDDSGSTRLPYYEFDDDSTKRYSRNTFSERSLSRKGRHNIVPSTTAHDGGNHSKNFRRVYPNNDPAWEMLYQEIPSPCDNVPVTINTPRRPPSGLSNRPQSSVSSNVTSAIVYGCGGKCQTFENICYFFLQLVFTMGILIGVSLCIAGIVLRKSAARNLQVLVYIGVLLAMVSALLLGIQCNARASAKRRKKAVLTAKRAPIPMETLQLHNRNSAAQAVAHQLMIVKEGNSQRVVQLPQVHQIVQSRSVLPPLPPPRRETLVHEEMIDEQGIPWWRRKDLNTR